MKAKIVLLCVLVLAGCETKPISEMNYAEVKAIAERIDKDCLAQGTKHNTRAWDNCVQIEIRSEHVRRAKNRDIRRGVLASIAAGAQGYADGYNAAARRAPVTCTTTPFRPYVNGPASTYTTSCY